MIRPRGARSSVRKNSRPPADSMNAMRAVEPCEQRCGTGGRVPADRADRSHCVARALERGDHGPAVIVADLDTEDGFALCRSVENQRSALCGSPRRWK